jgi:hypothetical protein
LRLPFKRVLLPEGEAVSYSKAGQPEWMRLQRRDNRVRQCLLPWCTLEVRELSQGLQVAREEQLSYGNKVVRAKDAKRLESSDCFFHTIACAALGH